MHIMYTMLYYIRIICAHIYVYSILTATPPTGFHGFNDKFQSRSDPDSKQKTETATCRSHFLLCFVGFHFGPDSKQKKETVVCTSHILNGFRFCDRLWPNMTKPVLLKKLKKSGVNKQTNKQTDGWRIVRYVCVSACAMRLRQLKLLRWSSDSELTLKLYTDDKSFRSSYIYILHV